MSAAKILRALALAVLFGLSACAHAPKRSSAAESAQCRGFCAKIDRCLGDEFSDEAKDQLCEIARCESGCRERVRSVAGYEGAFQYDRGTWRTVCGPIFVRRGLENCGRIDARNDVCCAAVCTAEIIANGGIERWPNCGKN